MVLPVQSDPPQLREDADGVVRIANTRIPLERVVRAFQTGATAEQIAQDFDALSLEDVYAVLNYYVHHRLEVDAYLATAQQQAADTRREVEQGTNPNTLRERLLARRSNGAA